MLHDSRKITDNVELSYTCLVWYFFHLSLSVVLFIQKDGILRFII
jgi:hypothetical protein